MHTVTHTQTDTHTHPMHTHKQTQHGPGRRVSPGGAERLRHPLVCVLVCLCVSVCGRVCFSRSFLCLLSVLRIASLCVYKCMRVSLCVRGCLMMFSNDYSKPKLVLVGQCTADNLIFRLKNILTCNNRVDFGSGFIAGARSNRAFSRLFLCARICRVCGGCGVCLCARVCVSVRVQV